MIDFKKGKKDLKKGFTIIEMVVVLALLSVILVVMLSLIEWHHKIYAQQQSQTLVTTTARNSMNEIQDYIAMAYRVVSSQTISGTTYNSGSSTIVLQLYSIDSSDAVIANTYDYVAFFLHNGKLYELISADGSSSRKSVNKVLSTVATSLTFTYDNATFSSVRTVNTDLQSLSTYNKVTSQGHIQEQTFLRNY